MKIFSSCSRFLPSGNLAQNPWLPTKARLLEAEKLLHSSDTFTLVGYGSLMNAKSAAACLERPLDKIAWVPIPGVRRIMNAALSGYSEYLRGPIHYLVLNLIPASKSHQTHVGVFQVTKAELEKLIERERFYRLVDMSPQVQGNHSEPFTLKGPMVTFVMPPERQYGREESSSLFQAGHPVHISQRYWNIVDEALNEATVPAEVAQNFREQTILPEGINMIEGVITPTEAAKVYW